MLHLLIKRSTGSDNLLLFLVAAAFSVLATRLWLGAANYPQIGFGQIHLAHAIWGALLLSVANILLLTFHGKMTRQLGAVVGGLGFGQIIDEVGKFVTRDNNYFYQPVPMIIYLTFVSLFFIYRYLDQYTPLSPKEILYDTLEHLEELAEGNLRLAMQKRITTALNTISQAGSQNYRAFAQSVSQMIQAAEIKPTHRNGYVQKAKSSWRWLDEMTTERRPVFYFLLCVFVAYIAVTFFSTITFSQIVWLRQFEHLQYAIDSRFEWGMILGQYISQLASALLMIRGFVFLVRRRKMKALEFFRNGLAVNLLITHIFTFYFKQFATVPELIVTIGMFAIIHNMLEDARS